MALVGSLPRRAVSNHHAGKRRASKDARAVWKGGKTVKSYLSLPKQTTTFYGKGGCVMRINIGRNLQRRFRSLVAIGGDLFLLGRSQSRMAWFSVLTCLIVISSSTQAAIPMIDLKQAVDTFVQSMPGTGQGGYKDPTTDLIARTRLVNGFQKARNGQLLRARKQLALVNYKARFYVDAVTGRAVVILQEQKVNGAYPRAWGLYVIAWPPKQN